MPSDCLSRLLLPTAIAAGEVRRGAGAAAEDDGAEDDGAAWRAPIGVGGGDASGVDVISAVGMLASRVDASRVDAAAPFWAPKGRINLALLLGLRREGLLALA